MAKKIKKDGASASQAIVDIVQNALVSQEAGFRTIGGRRAKKVARQVALHERLKEALPEEDPRLAAVRLNIQRSKEAVLAYEQRARRLANVHPVEKNQWVITGTVRLANGRSAIGYTIEVFDKELKYHDQLGTATTNEYGDFQIRYIDGQFDDDFRKKDPDIFIKVRDPKGQGLLGSEAPLKMIVGRIDHFTIVLGKQ